MLYRTVVIFIMSGEKKFTVGPEPTVLYPVYPIPSVCKATPPSYSTLMSVTAEVAADVEN
jgi:hypothetical protein